MKLWLDDIRPPWEHGCIGWKWVQTAEDAIEALASGEVTQASLDHDLSMEATMGCPQHGEETGYTVVCWMEEHNIWPVDGVTVHSMNPAGKAKMLVVIRRHYWPEASQ